MNSIGYLPLEARQLGVTLNRRHCLQDINFSLKQEGVTAIMGANGAGKTLLLKTCAGLIAPSHGSLQWSRQPMPPKLTLVPQQAVLLNRSVADNLLIPLKRHKVARPPKRCRDALAWAGIGHLINHNALSLSTGEQQLLALSRAWALAPKVLLLDEPSANLDPQRQQQINALIAALSVECKILLTTHSMQQARELATDILLLNRGRLFSHTSAEQFFSANNLKPFSCLAD